MTPLVVRDLPHIPRHTGVPDEDSFDGLRGRAMELVQQLAHLTWTDYNEHDPGVTVLEQLCYALTDVMYRASFPVEDFLAGESGAIDWRAHALLPPELAFPSRPTTCLDYEAVIQDALFDEVENVSVIPIKEAANGESRSVFVDGLYRVLLRLRLDQDGDQRPEPQKAAIAGKVRDLFAGERNLGEDLEEVCVLDERNEVQYVLDATVEIADGFDPALVLARIYSACVKKLAGGLTFERFDLALSRGPEEMFRGPFTRFGVVTKNHEPPPAKTAAQDISGTISEVPGVLNVAIVPPALSDDAPTLIRPRIPQSQKEIKVVLLNAGRQIVVPWFEFMMRYKQELRAERIARYTPDEISGLLPRPRGIRRNLSEYQSVQNLFPPVYGIGPRGLPETARPERKAQARQLQAWLLLFDQHLADYLAMLDGIRELFPVSTSPRRTYFSQVLGPDSVPGIADIYPPCPAEALGNLLDGYDHRDRTKRLLDYFLALYGESLPEAATGPSRPEESLRDADPLIKGRLACLADIGSFVQNRAAGADSTLPASERKLSGLEARLNRILGFSLSDIERVRVIEHVLLRPVASSKADKVPPDFYRFGVTVLFPRVRGQDSQFDRVAGSALDASCPAHIHPSVCWVSRDDMTRFDDLHGKWWTCRRQILASPATGNRWTWRREDHSDAVKDTDAAAQKLIAFLLERAERSG